MFSKIQGSLDRNGNPDGVGGALVLWQCFHSPEKYRSGTGNGVVLRAGFSLLELIIVLGVIGILATVAMPSYQSHLRAATAKEGALSLLAFASLQERLRITRGEYQTESVLLAHQSLSNHLRQHYRLSVALSQPASFKLSLLPTAQTSRYPVLTLDSQGRRMPTEFWP